MDVSRRSKPWMNEEFLVLLEKCCIAHEPTEIKELSKQIKKLRWTLKGTYFKEKADKINVASEQRDTEEEFRLSENHTSLPRTNMQLAHPTQQTGGALLPTSGPARVPSTARDTIPRQFPTHTTTRRSRICQ